MGCGSSLGIAVKLGVPDLEIEDRLILAHSGTARINFQATAISRHGDDLILTGILDKPEIATRSFSLGAKKEIATLHPKTMMDSHALGAPKRIASSELYIKEQRSPASAWRTLVLLDGRSGATVQEIGPVTGPPHPGTFNVLVSPDGKMVAHFGRYEIRFYRVNADAQVPDPRDPASKGNGQ